MSQTKPETKYSALVALTRLQGVDETTMETVLNHFDPVLLDNVYRSAFRLAQATCGAGVSNTTHPDWWIPSPSPQASGVIIDKSRAWLCHLAADPRLWQRDGIWRQSLSIFFLTWISSTFFYFLFGTVCYYLNFDQTQKKQPKYRPNQIRAEITASLTALLIINVLTVPIFMAQVRGWAKIYPFGTGSTWYVIPTPFAAYAFEPIEGWIMSLPVYAYSFLFPMSDVGHLVVFFISNIWTFLLHDNSDQFHTVHHKSIQFNFGQFSALWDRVGGTYADPRVFFEPKGLREKRGSVKSLEIA
ncbi:uncharacterized protein C8A04DRAFT_36256 [Dichotomopilus funicola]|uniref:Fatty acid hydroxylase domain-containing protein n=1 Tax=Dichotomopilus funicola TaxID=1934379 RepID=A0AAN6V506_9PEZI|nr:hypothetical protein C8A04DRAFT_36256 [Dichotomopilus funicola]